MKICKIAFCGTGKWVMTHHIPNFLKMLDRYKIAGFFDCFQEKSDEAAKMYGGKVYHSLEELAADPDIDLVIVATKPVPTHFENTLALLDAGKNVVLEKPMTYDSAQCDLLIAKAKEKGVLFSVHHNMRYSTTMRAAQEVLRTKAVGEPVIIEIHSPRSWYDAIDFSNYAAHMTDQALALNTAPLKEVSATLLHPENGMGGAGYGSALLRFEQGPKIWLSLNPAPLKQADGSAMNFSQSYFRIYIAGTKNAVGIKDFGPTPNGEGLLSRKYDYFDNEEPNFSDPEFVKTLDCGYFDMFYQAWAYGEKLAVTPEQARNVIRCIELMVESSLQGRAVPATNMLPGTFE